MAEGRIAVDLAEVVGKDDKYRTTLGWGDAVEVLGETKDRVSIGLTDYKERRDGSVEPVSTEGYIRKKGKDGVKVSRVVVPPDENRVLKVDFVDVQQGDGTVVETPDGKVVLIDGGDNQLFARYLAGRYRGTTLANPRKIDAILVTHGDADHFAGLSEILESEGNSEPKKRLFMQPERVFHNGLVKRPSSLPDAKQLGPTKKVGKRTILTGLVEDLREVDRAEMNEPFKRWRATLDTYTSRGDIEMRRLEHGYDDAFAFLGDEDIEAQVLGPIPVTVDGVTGLEFFGAPQRRFGHPSMQPQSTYSGVSPSHAINGHSVVLRLGYGKWRFMFAGDLNEQAEEVLVEEHEAGKVDLQSEVFKVPHHGSAEFLKDYLKAVNPVVSVVSSGDESARKEYIHPRATLMAGLGRYGRDVDPVIFVTELVAFFAAEGYVLNSPPPKEKGWSSRRDRFFAFSRSAFGIVRVRTDGERLFVYTNSGQDKLKESYAFTLSGDGTAVPQQLIRV